MKELPQGKPVANSFNLPEAPAFRPTKQEWQDPLRFIASIRDAVEPYGLCKIIPPDDWKPPFALDTKNLRFPTRKQLIHELQDRNLLAHKQKAFAEKYAAFVGGTGIVSKKNPVVFGEEVDLFRLYNVVQKRGGFEKVTSHKKWREVAGMLQVADGSSSAGNALRQVYQKYLADFEQHECGQQGSQTLSVVNRTPARRESRKQTLNKKYAAETTRISVKANESPEPPTKKRKTDKKGEKEHGSKPGKSPSTAARVPQNIDTLVCELCNGGSHEEQIILCDRCDRGFHTYCMSPPLVEIPEGDWICPLCLAAESEKFAFKPGQTCSWDEFERVADKFRNSYWGGAEAASKVSYQEIEAAFWQIVEKGEEHIEVLYGADLESSRYGSGFPKQGVSKDEYALDKWNLNNLPRQEGSFSSALRFIDDDVSGVIVPWLYIGMLFSAFCWHVEDHLFYSANFLHYGAPKRWYSVPFNALKDFEEAFKKTVPEQFAAQPDLLFQLITTLSPRVLTKHKVPICTLVQEQGELIISFPGAYHAGFNHGFNCAEAVNFVPPDWFKYAAASVDRYRRYRKPSVISQEELLLRVAAKDSSPYSAFWVESELRRVLQEEAQLRYQCWERGVKMSTKLSTQELGSAEEPECAVCHQYLHLSGLECECMPKRQVCLHHADLLCDCPAYKNRMVFRYSLAELEEIWRQAAAKASTADTVLPVKAATADAADDGAGMMDVDMREEVEPVADTGVKEEAQQAAANTSTVIPEPDTTSQAAAGPDKMEYTTMNEAPDLSATEPQQASNSEGKTCSDPEQGETKDLSTSASSETEDQVGQVSVGDNPPAQSVAPPSATVAETPPDAKPADAAVGAVADEAQHVRPLEYGPLVEGLQKKYEAKSKSWRKKAEAILKLGNGKLSEIDHLLQDSQQFLWGLGETCNCADLQQELQKVRTWVADVTACIRGKPSLEQASALVAWDPPPVTVPGFVKLRNAVKQAQTVQQEVANMLQKGLAHAELKEVEAQMKAASKLTLSIPGISELEAHATAVQGLRASVTNALAKSGKHAMAVADLKALHAQALASAPDMPELAKLQANVDAVEQWQTRAKAVLLDKSSMDDVKALLDDGEKLHAIVPEVGSLRTLLQKAKSWVTEANAAIASTTATLKQWRDLLHTGEQLPVLVTQVETLQQKIRKREWEDNVKKALHAKSSTMPQVDHLLEEAAVIIAADSALALELQARKEAALKWSSEADTALLASQGGSTEGPPTLEELQELLASGQKLGMKLEQLTTVQELVNKCVEWQAVAGKLLARVGSDLRPSCSALQAAVQSGEELVLHVPEMDKLKEVLDAADAWGQKARALLQQPASKVDLASIQALESSALEIGIDLEDMTALQAFRSALEWCKEASSKFAGLLSTAKTAAVDGATPAQATPPASHKASEEEVHEHAGSKENGSSAEEQATERAAVTPEPSGPDMMDEEAGQVGAVKDASGAAEAAMDAKPAGTDQDVDMVDAPEDAGKAAEPAAAGSVRDATGGATGEAEEDAAQDVAVTAADSQANLKSEVHEAAPTCAAVPWEARPELGVALELISRAAGLAVDQALLSSLQASVDRAKSWQQRVSQCTQPAGSLAAGGHAEPQLSDVQNLLQEGRKLPFKMAEMQELQTFLDQQHAWESRAKALLDLAKDAAGDKRPTLEAVKALQGQATARLVGSDLSIQLNSLAAAGEAWLERCRLTILRKGIILRLDKCLQIISSNLSLALDAFRDIAVLPHKDLGLACPDGGERRSRRRKVHTAKDDEPHKLYCLCQQHYSSDPNMVLCDDCNDWYHTRCVGLSQQAAKSLKKWSCPLCVWSRSEAAANKPWPQGVHKSASPSLAQLEALLEARPQQLLLPEEGMLEEVVNAMRNWQTLVNQALTSHSRQRTLEVETGRESCSKLLLNAAKLREVVKQACALELDASAVRQRALGLLRVEAWRSRASATWAGGNKPTWDQVNKIAEDAAACGVNEDVDMLAQEVLQLHAAGKPWMQQYKELAPKLKAAAHSRQDQATVAKLSEQAAALVAQAPKLGLKLDKEVADLNESSKLYCLCKQLYDERRPMLSCDYCENWFHYDCIGLEAPTEDQDAPDDFCCPECSAAASRPYPHLNRMPALLRQQFKPAAAPTPRRPPTSSAVKGSSAGSATGAGAGSTHHGSNGRAEYGAKPVLPKFVPGQALPVTLSVAASRPQVLAATVPTACTSLPAGMLPVSNGQPDGTLPGAPVTTAAATQHSAISAAYPGHPPATVRPSPGVAVPTLPVNTVTPESSADLQNYLNLHTPIASPRATQPTDPSVSAPADTSAPEPTTNFQFIPASASQPGNPVLPRWPNTAAHSLPVSSQLPATNPVAASYAIPQAPLGSVPFPLPQSLHHPGMPCSSHMPVLTGTPASSIHPPPLPYSSASWVPSTYPSYMLPPSSTTMIPTLTPMMVHHQHSLNSHTAMSSMPQPGAAPLQTAAVPVHSFMSPHVPMSTKPASAFMPNPGLPPTTQASTGIVPMPVSDGNVGGGAIMGLPSSAPLPAWQQPA